MSAPKTTKNTKADILNSVASKEETKVSMPKAKLAVESDRVFVVALYCNEDNSVASIKMMDTTLSRSAPTLSKAMKTQTDKENIIWIHAESHEIKYKSLLSMKASLSKKVKDFVREKLEEVNIAYAHRLAEEMDSVIVDDAAKSKEAIQNVKVGYKSKLSLKNIEVFFKGGSIFMPTHLEVDVETMISLVEDYASRVITPAYEKYASGIYPELHEAKDEEEDSKEEDDGKEEEEEAKEEEEEAKEEEEDAKEEELKKPVTITKRAPKRPVAK